MKKWSISVFILLFVAGQAGVVKADELSDLKEQLAEQTKVLQQMQQRLSQLEASQKAQEQKVDQKISEAVKSVEEVKVSSLPEGLKWAEAMKISGDFRYRHETIDDQTANTGRNRNRIRARIKLDATISDELNAIFRVATGSSDSPTSTNHTLGDSTDDSFSSKELWLDHAYVDYHPSDAPGLNVLAGKMGVPFYKVGKHQLLFDGDLSPEGGAVTYGFDLDDKTTARLAGGAFWFRERSSAADTGFFAAQAMLTHELSDDSHILGGVSYYDFGNIEGQTLNGISANGNSQSGGAYLNDYNIIEGFGEYGFKLDETPVALYGAYINNTGADNSEDTAWIFGTKYNKAKAPGTWEVSYNYRDVEKDAVLGGICDSDFIGGGTDGKGHVFGFKYQLSKSVYTDIYYFLNEKNASTTEDDYQMLQANMVFKF